jgi:D-aspartate ligase
MGATEKGLNSDFSTPVVIFDADDRLSLGVARSLGRLGVPVYGLTRFPRNPSVYSKFYKQKFYLPENVKEKSEIVNNLVKIAQKIGKRAILLCTSDANVRISVEFNEKLEKYFIFHKLPKGLADSILSKKLMRNLAKQYGISSPKTLFPKSTIELEECIGNLKFPVVIKAVEPDKDMIEGKRFFLAETKDDLIEIYKRNEDIFNRNFMLQEFIPHLAGFLWIFHGYFNDISDSLFSATGVKSRQSPFYGGVTSLGICQYNKELDFLSKQFMKKIKYKGIVDIEFVYDQRDCTYKILDINPRMGANFRLFAGKGDFDVVRAQYLDLTGQFVPHIVVSNGRKWVLENEDFFSSFNSFTRGILSVGQWLKSLIGVREVAWFAVDDVLPFFVMIIYEIRKTSRKL